MGRVLAFLLALCPLGLVPMAARSEPAGPARAPRAAVVDSLPRAPLPFVARPGQPFAASDLTRKYSKDIAPFMKPGLGPPTDLRTLDQAAAQAAAARSQPVPIDSSDIRLVEAARRRGATDLTPEEKKQVNPPKAGAYVGIPSPVAATGALLGGLALLIKLIAQLAR